MGTYYQLGQAQQAFDTAKQILADDPNDFGALYIVVTLVQAVAGSAGDGAQNWEQLLYVGKLAN